MHDRKIDHIELAAQAKIDPKFRDQRFFYEPLFASHQDEMKWSYQLAGKTIRTPIWISSMTGGIRAAGLINKTLARSAAKYGLGMGLGSIRMALAEPGTCSEFQVREELGPDLPLFGNLGIAQLEKLLADKEIDRLEELACKLELDGICIHVNPLQEWCQPEGDSFSRPPIETIQDFTRSSEIKLIVKEVGQGMGPESLKALMRLPLEAIEFGAFGGTNFSKLEELRAKNEQSSPLVNVGHTALEMVEFINSSLSENDLCQKFIISGGVNDFLDGHYLMEKLKVPAIYGQAAKLLEYARKGQESLDGYIETQIDGLKMAKRCLRVRM